MFFKQRAAENATLSYFFGCAGNGLPMRLRGGTVFRRGGARQLRVELLDLGFQRRDLVVERARLVGNRIRFFIEETHAASLAEQDGNENSQRAKRHE